MADERKTEPPQTSEKYQKALKFIDDDNTSELNALVRSGLDLSEVDDHGTSLLQHAAFRGRSQMVEFIIKHGCDVNITKHEHQYSTLHFAALSGDITTVGAVLTAGAKTDVENSVKRSPAEMAAFTGQTHIASYIKAFFPPSVFLHYTDPSVGASLQCQSTLSYPLHKIATNYNVHPVRLAMILKENTIILENVAVSVNILECERDKQFKKENNDVLSLRLHFIACLIQKLNELHKIDEKKTTEKGDKSSSPENEEKGWKSSCDVMIKWLLKPAKGSLKDYNLDRFVKTGLKQYPFTQNQLLQQAVKAITTKSEDGHEVSAISVYLQFLTGSQASFIMSDSHCVACMEKLRNHLRCSRCKDVQYCDKKCQAFHWPAHKKDCKP